MYINKGKESFAILNITSEEMAIFVDSLNTQRLFYIETLKLKPEKFCKQLGLQDPKTEPSLRKLLSGRVPTIGDMQRQISKHVGS